MSETIERVGYIVVDTYESHLASVYCLYETRADANKAAIKRLRCILANEQVSSECADKLVEMLEGSDMVEIGNVGRLVIATVYK